MTFDEYKNKVIDCMKAYGLTDEQAMEVLEVKEVFRGWNNGLSAEKVAEAILF